MKSFFKRKHERAKTNALIYAIGDVHGRHDLLLQLLAEIRSDIAARVSSFSGPAIIIFLGDYIDRGKSSRDVINTLCSLNIDNTEIIFLKGNHEAAFLGFIDGVDSGSNWLKFGGRETLASYGLEIPQDIKIVSDWEPYRRDLIKNLPANHLSFLRTLRPYKILGEYMFVHAGVHPDKPVESQTEEDYLWIRGTFLQSMKKLPYIIVHGHTPEKAPVWDGRRIGIDTGAYMTNQLTAVRLIGGDVSFLST